MRTVLSITVVLAAVATLCGCGHRTAPAAAKPAAKAKAAVPLPEWAPKHPSPAFLRAAKVLRPMPAEQFGQKPEEQSMALPARLAKILPAGYEYFGMLSDRQIDQLESSKELLIPVKSLTTQQRAAFNGYVHAYHDAMRGLAAHPGIPESAEDVLITLYELGAKEDLSNVDAGFGIVGRSVNTAFRIRLPGGKDTQFYGITLGSI